MRNGKLKYIEVIRSTFLVLSSRRALFTIANRKVIFYPTQGLNLWHAFLGNYNMITDLIYNRIDPPERFRNLIAFFWSLDNPTS